MFYGHFVFWTTLVLKFGKASNMMVKEYLIIIFRYKIGVTTGEAAEWAKITAANDWLYLYIRSFRSTVDGRHKWVDGYFLRECLATTSGHHEISDFSIDYRLSVFCRVR